VRVRAKRRGHEGGTEIAELELGVKRQERHLEGIVNHRGHEEGTEITEG